MASRAEPGRPRRAIRCWQCEELLALVSCDHQVLVEANAEMATADGDPAIICRCGASTALSGEWECDAR